MDKVKAFDKLKAEAEAQGEYEDVELSRKERKLQLKRLEQELGEKDTKQQLKDGMVKLIRGASRLHVNEDGLRLHRTSNAGRDLRDLNNPAFLRRR